MNVTLFFEFFDRDGVKMMGWAKTPAQQSTFPEASSADSVRFGWVFLQILHPRTMYEGCYEEQLEPKLSVR